MTKLLSVKTVLAWSLLLYVVLTGLLIGRVPLGATPDEAAHWDYIAYVAEHQSVPVFKITKAPDYGYEFHQPPLYYVLNAPVWSAFQGSDAAKYAVRIFSMICGALCLVLLWDALKVLFPEKPTLIISATLFGALWPMHQAVGASGGNDALTGLACAALLWILVRGRVTWDWRHSLALGAVAGLAILTKSSCLIAVFVAFGAMLHLLWRVHKSTFPRLAAQLGIALLVTALVGGWWLMRNQLLYGDLLAMGVFQQAFSQSSPGPALFFAAGMSVGTYLRALFSITFCTFWGLFGGPNKAIDVVNPFGVNGAQPIALMALPLVLLFLAASIIGIWGIWRKLRDGFDKSTFAHVVLTWWMLDFALVALSWVQFNTQFFQAQARYLHPAFLPIAAGLCYGWAHIWGEKGKKLNAVSALVALALIATSLWNIWGWRTLT